MEEILGNTEQGRKRKQLAEDRINTYIAERLEKSAKERRVDDNQAKGNHNKITPAKDNEEGMQVEGSSSSSSGGGVNIPREQE